MSVARPALPRSGSGNVLYLNDPRYQYCMRVGMSVRICRVEDECRREHGCVKPDCPLARAFGFDVFDVRMRQLASMFDLWPCEDAMLEDFP